MAAEDRYEDFLNRLDLPIEAWEDKERLREALVDILGSEPTDAQVEALWETMETERASKWDEPWLEEHGVSTVPVSYPWGTQIRYAIQGLPGLWSRETIEMLREEEGW